MMTLQDLHMLFNLVWLWYAQPLVHTFSVVMQVFNSATVALINVVVDKNFVTSLEKYLESAFPEVATVVLFMIQVYFTVFVLYLLYSSVQFLSTTIIDPLLSLIGFIILLPFQLLMYFVHNLVTLYRYSQYYNIEVLTYRNYKVDQSRTIQLSSRTTLNDLKNVHGVDLTKGRVMLSNTAAPVIPEMSRVLQPNDRVLLFID